MREIVIQKFGGSSVATPERRDQVIDKVINCINSGYKLQLLVEKEPLMRPIR
ncbi:aspartokinase [Halanaerobacter jeridensis]|uniref:Aspartokinase n=1 Tax=Halanaerobacter jeridensis TaxID=706427 RepID=A0A938XW12_9FIRM|nr:aspartokinase [Halanaerobacter jeridensis]